MIRFAALILLSLGTAHAETCPAGMVTRVVREWPMPVTADAVMHYPVLYCPAIGECWMAPEVERVVPLPETIVCLTPEAEAAAEGRAR